MARQESATKRSPRIKTPDDTPNKPRGRILDRLEGIGANGNNADDDDPNVTPSFVGEGEWLIGKKDGALYPWNEAMANRSDLVELYDEERHGPNPLSAVANLGNFDTLVATR